LAESQILLNDFKRQWADTGESVLDAVGAWARAAGYVLGREVADFERTLAARVGRAHAIGCASGLDAIEIGLRASGVTPAARCSPRP